MAVDPYYNPTKAPNGMDVGALAFSGIKQPGGVEYTIGAEDTNVINVAGQINDGLGNDLATATALKAYLADDAAGLTPSTSAPDGGIAIGTDGALVEWTANLSGLLISEADGDFDIDITHAAGAATWYLVVVLPSGQLVVSGAITFA